ncbi:MAG: class I SAM-dependent methyltransferase [Crocinitomicaceae bacterium]
MKYLWQSRTRYHVHSPFVFNFINEVLRAPSNINDLLPYCSLLQKDSTRIEIHDFGAGSRKSSSNIRSIKEIYRNSSSHPKKADLIRRICAYELESFKVIELGTNLGVTTFALSQSSKCNQVWSIEGCPNLFKFSSEKLSEQDKVHLSCSQFEQIVPSLLETQRPEVVYIDGNHTYEATLTYFNWIKNESSVELIIFDDIHWSDGMLKAWKELILDSEFHVSVELFNLGILWRRAEQRKEHFVLRY